MCSMAFLFGTGNAPGSAKHTGQTWVFGSPPKTFGQPQNILLTVLSSTWHSIPMTTSYLARVSGVTTTGALTVLTLQLLAATKASLRAALPARRRVRHPARDVR